MEESRGVFKSRLIGLLLQQNARQSSRCAKLSKRCVVLESNLIRKSNNDAVRQLPASGTYGQMCILLLDESIQSSSMSPSFKIVFSRFQTVPPFELLLQNTNERNETLDKYFNHFI